MSNHRHEFFHCLACLKLPNFEQFCTIFHVSAQFRIMLTVNFLEHLIMDIFCLECTIVVASGWISALSIDSRKFMPGLQRRITNAHCLVVLVSIFELKIRIYVRFPNPLNWSPQSINLLLRHQLTFSHSINEDGNHCQTIEREQPNANCA